MTNFQSQESILLSVNRCRIAHQIYALSDFVSGDGRSIQTKFCSPPCQGGAQSSLEWSTDQPSQLDWSRWTSNLTHMFPRGAVTKPLGRWHTVSYRTLSWFYSKETDEFYRKQDSALQVYLRHFTVSLRQSMYRRTSQVISVDSSLDIVSPLTETGAEDVFYFQGASEPPMLREVKNRLTSLLQGGDMALEIGLSSRQRVVAC